MGSCNSVICSASRVEKIGQCDQVERKDESGESKGAPEVEIHMNCPSNAGPWESELVDQRENTGSASVVSSSAEVLGFEADDELSSDTSFQSVEESDHGKGEARNCAEREPGPSGLHNTPKLSRPPLRSSKGKELYSKNLEQKQQPGEGKLKRKPWYRPRTKHNLSQEEEAHANKIRIIKKIINAVKKVEAQKPDSRQAALTTDEAIAKIYGVAVEDCRDSSLDNCSSSSSPSSTGTSTSSTESDEDLEQPRTGRHLREVQTASAGVKNMPQKDVKTTSHVAASWESFSESKKDFQKASTAGPWNGANLTSENAKNGRDGANTTGASANSWDSSTTSDEAFENSSTSLEEEYKKPNVERREIKSTLQSGQTGATKASSWNSWDSSTTSDSTTSDEASESSSTSLEEEYEKPKVERTYRQIKSTLQSGQTGATKASSRNSWDSSTTSDEAFENSPTNVEEEYEKQKHKECIGLSWPFRVFKSTPDMVKKRAASAPVGVCSESSNSWHSSTALDEDFQKPSTPGTETNVQFGARAKSCSGSSKKSSTNSHEGIDQLTLQSEANKQKRARKARKWFRFKTNKVAPLQ